MAATLTDSIVPRPLRYTCHMGYSLYPHGKLVHSLSSGRHVTEEECIQAIWKEFLCRVVRSKGINAADLAMIRAEFGARRAEIARRGNVYEPLTEHPVTRERMARVMEQYMTRHEMGYCIQYLYSTPTVEGYVNASRPDGWASQVEVESRLRRMEDE